MKTIDRRDFLKMAGAGTAAAVAAGATGFFAWNGTKDMLRFRAVAGMPKEPLPAYASYVVAGKVDLKARTGQLTKSLYAGAPEAMSGIVFPGTARTVRVTDVAWAGESVRIQGELTDTSALLTGETSIFSIVVDQKKGIATADFFGSKVLMQLDE